MDQTVASSGTLVSAALQAAGYFYQSVALDALTSPFRGLYWLIYVFAGAAALTSFVVTGRVKNLKWLLIGPVAFAIILNQRTPSDGPEWRYGTKVYDDAIVKERVKSLTNQPLYQPYVSTVFLKFDVIVSSAFQGIIATLNQARKDSDLKLLVRADLYGMMMNRELTDPGLRELVHVSLLGECRDMMKSGREMADPKNAPLERCEHAKQYQQKAVGPRIQLSDASAALLAVVKVLHPAMYEATSANSLEAELGNFAAEFSKSNAFACVIPASASVPPTVVDAATLAMNAVKSDMASVPQGSELVRTRQEVLDADGPLAGKESEVQGAFQHIKNQTYSCHDIWNLTYKGLHYDAARTKEATLHAAQASGLDADGIKNDLEGMTGMAGEEQIVRAISRRLFRSEASTRPTSAIIAEYAKAGSNVSQIGVPGEGSAMNTERGMIKMREYSSKYRLLSTAASLPYYQGMLLHFLAVIFPFFALLLLLPNRFQAFFLWFSLWIWLKSWDIGFALAAFIDDALFAIFTSQFSDTVAQTDQTLHPSLSIAVESLRDLDPSFNIGTYYNLMAMVLMTIPFVTGQILVGWFGMGFKLIEDGASALAGAAGTGGFRMAGQANLDSLRHATNEEKIRAGISRVESGNSTFGERNYLHAEAVRNYAFQSRSMPLGHSPTSMLDGSVTGHAVSGLGGGVGINTRLQGFSAGLDRIPSAVGNVAGTVAKAYQSFAGAEMRERVAQAEKNVGNTTGIRYGIQAVQHGALNVQMGENDDVFVARMNTELAGIKQAVEIGASVVDAGADSLPQARSLRQPRIGMTGVALGAAGLATGAYYGTTGPDRDDAVRPLDGTVEFVSPVYEEGVTSRFGAGRRGAGGSARSHGGTDVVSSRPEVFASAGGRVVFSGKINGYGNTVIIQHNSNTFTLYAHLQDNSITVPVGAVVTSDHQIGLIGDTGNAKVPGKDNSHLHYELIQVDYQNNGQGQYRPIFYQADAFSEDGTPKSRQVMNQGMSKLMSSVMVP